MADELQCDQVPCCHPVRASLQPDCSLALRPVGFRPLWLLRRARMGLCCGLLSAATQVYKLLLEYLAILTIWSESQSMEVNVTGTDFTGC